MLGSSCVIFMTNGSVVIEIVYAYWSVYYREICKSYGMKHCTIHASIASISEIIREAYRKSVKRSKPVSEKERLILFSKRNRDVKFDNIYKHGSVHVNVSELQNLLLLL